MNFEQQIAEVERSSGRLYAATQVRRWAVLPAVAVLVIGLIASNLRWLDRHRSISAEYADFKALAIEQIDTLAAELQAARAQLEATQRQVDTLNVQNADLKRLADQARSLMDDLSATYSELDQAQIRIKDLIARRDSLQAFQHAQADHDAPDANDGGTRGHQTNILADP